MTDDSGHALIDDFICNRDSLFGVVLVIFDDQYYFFPEKTAFGIPLIHGKGDAISEVHAEF